MNLKKIMAGLLTSVICMSLLTACGNNGTTESKVSSEPAQQSEQSKQSEESKKSDQSETEQTKVDNMHTLFIKDKSKNAEMTAVFYNNQTSKAEEIKMQKTGEGDDYFIYSCSADTEKYNMVHLKYGDSTTKDAAFNNCVSGWELYEGEFIPYDAKKDQEFKMKYETKEFSFNNADKKVYIWTPEDYDAKGSEKYSTIYMMDGQTVLSTKISGELRSWNVAEHTASMMSESDNKAILVCIEAGSDRFA